MSQISDAACKLLALFSEDTLWAAYGLVLADSRHDAEKAVEASEASIAAWERYKDSLLAGAEDEALLAAAWRAKTAADFAAALAAESRTALGPIIAALKNYNVAAMRAGQVELEEEE
jgi:hypothetical protein